MYSRLTTKRLMKGWHREMSFRFKKTQLVKAKKLFPKPAG